MIAKQDQTESVQPLLLQPLAQFPRDFSIGMAVRKPSQSQLQQLHHPKQHRKSIYSLGPIEAKTCLSSIYCAQNIALATNKRFAKKTKNKVKDRKSKNKKFKLYFCIQQDSPNFIGRLGKDKQAHIERSLSYCYNACNFVC